MKVIFVDVDGPLAYGTYMEGRFKIGKISMPYPWVKEACDALAQIIKETDAKVVISSDWKLHYTLEQLGQIFEHYNIPNVIIDKTHAKRTSAFSYELELERSTQIMDWVDEHKDEIESWIAIDDLRLDGYFGRATAERPHILAENHIWLEGDWSDVNAKLHENVEKIVNHLNKK